MASVNKCIFVGNVTKDPETRYMPNGEAVTNFSIAVNETWKDKQGNKQERVEFVNLIAYRKLGEIIGEYVKRGQSLFVEGKMQTRKWQDKSGQDRYSTEIICDQMQMLGGKKDSESVNTQRQDKPSNDKESAWDDSDIGF